MNAITNQIEYVNAQIAAVAPNTGLKVDRKWYFKKKGVYHSYVRYGTGQLKINGKITIDCGPALTDVLKSYDLLYKAVNAGELDDIIEAHLNPPKLMLTYQPSVLHLPVQPTV
jgi:hypothetical protein